MTTSAPMTDAEIAALAELERKATGAPWIYDASEGWGYITDGEGNLATDVDDEDGPFIAAARNAVPRLLDTIAADRAEIARLRKALDEAEACMSIVEPRSDKAEYLRILGVVRDALKEPRHE